ncbi:MAG: hypothetical protein WEA04_02450 [Candidatus Andersenbacteria bacterium]
MEWEKMSLAEQLGNVGSDYERALRWKEKNQPLLFKNAAARTLEQLDRTLTNPKLLPVRRREIARLRDEVCSVLFENEKATQSSRGLQKYFLSMATLARNKKGM